MAQRLLERHELAWRPTLVQLRAHCAVTTTQKPRQRRAYLQNFFTRGVDQPRNALAVRDLRRDASTPSYHSYADSYHESEAVEVVKRDLHDISGVCCNQKLVLYAHGHQVVQLRKHAVAERKEATRWHLIHGRRIESHD